MKNPISNILNKLYNGEIDFYKALDLIKSIDVSGGSPAIKKKASKLKIYVISEDRTINIPPIPFGLLNFLIDLSYGLGNIILRFTDDIDEEIKEILNNIDREEVKLIINELKNHGPFDMVKVSDGEDKVKISVI